MAKISYIVSDRVKTIALAAGFNHSPPVVDVCALQTGDIISFPDVPGLFFRVTARWLEAASATKAAEWNVFLEPSPDPLLQRASP